MSYAAGHVVHSDWPPDGAAAEAMPLMAAGPTVARLQLGAELRRLRYAAGITGDAAAEKIHGSAAKISRLEGGQSPVQDRDLAALLSLYGTAGKAAQERLGELARLSRDDDWWAPLADLVTAPARHHLNLEAEAAEIWVYEPQAVPPLLQTHAYTQALAALNQYDMRWRGGLGPRVMARRRGVLRLASPPKIWALIQYSALIRNPSDDPKVMREQLASLLTDSAKPGIALQVVPDDTHQVLSAPGPFALLRFAQPDVPTHVFRETLTAITCTREPSEVDRHHEVFDTLAVAALAPAPDSRALIQELLAGLPGGRPE
ncbi:MAG: helix-turn-helix domain-containing protein [Streptosporangiaceae bacterium]